MTTGRLTWRIKGPQIRKRFGTRVVVKDVCSQSVREWSFLGPNGAGKTCFYMIAGLIKADQGSIHLAKQVITQRPWMREPGWGWDTSPEPSIFETCVRDNILAILETVTDLEPHERLSKTDALINEFQLDHVASALGMALSGERRRAGSRTLACEPRFLLLDEPFAGVDPISVGDIKAMIRQLAARGIGVLITDHNVKETQDICQRAYIVNDGSLIARDLLPTFSIMKWLSRFTWAMTLGFDQDNERNK